MTPGRHFPEKISSKAKPSISLLDLLVEESTCTQVEGEAPEPHMIQMCGYVWQCKPFPDSSKGDHLK